jgi:hypothetical protein
MARSKVDFDTVRTIGLAWPGVEDGTAYGNLALKALGNLLACVPHASLGRTQLSCR